VNNVLILDIQHAGKISSPNDRGAAEDIDKDGKISIRENEAELTPIIVHGVVTSTNRAPDTSVEVLTYGEYGMRQAHANRLAARYDKAIYLALHLNAGKPSAPWYGLFGYDWRSSNGAKFAKILAGHWKSTVPDSRTLSVSSGDTDYKKHMHNTIAGIYSGPSNIFGICSEPLFIEDTTPTKLLRYGDALHLALRDFVHVSF